MKLALILALLVLSTSVWTQVTYQSQIAPILSKSCTGCHQNGDIGPMPLTTYKEVASYATMIKFVTDIKLMPPFKADYHSASYKNVRAITEEDKALIAAWIEGGLIKGDSTYQDDTEFIQEPAVFDTSLCMLEAFEHYGIYYDQYQVFPLKTHFGEDLYIKNIVFEPGNKEIVRSAQLSLSPRGSSRKMDEWDPRYGYFAYGNLGFISSHPNWYSWMPHSKGLELEEQERLFLPKDSEILFHLHYGPYGQVEQDSSCVHLTFDRNANAAKLLQNVPLFHTEFLKDTFLLKAHSKHRISSSLEFPIDVKLRSVTPLAHLLCRSWNIFAVLPDKSSVILLSIDDWDFHWKEKYVFEKPIELPAGTKIYCTAIYDNTTNNPYNPSDPPYTMKVGPHMYNENYECYFEILAKENTQSYIKKPFAVCENELSELSFFVEKGAVYSIKVYNLFSSEECVISSKNYASGLHSIRSSKLPSSKGRYVVTLMSFDSILDSWWLVIL